ncbi:unnamed protein product [Coffea canephora]|uniref:Cytochrome P450 n=1 Tax=Coffea canephora TaxID=49390 RepID=A0A068VCD1_COFCA|nr:unnamed protein product [Coffea canephora]
MAKEIFKTHDIIFASRPSHHPAFKLTTYNFTDIMSSPHNDYWRELRKICNMELLSQKRVQTFKTVREDEVFDLMNSISSQQGSIFNISRSIFSLTYGITSRAAFGKRNERTERFLQILDEHNDLLAGFNLADMYPSIKLLQVMSPLKFKLDKAHKQSDEILEDILNEHKRKIKEAKDEGREGEDLVDILLNVQKSGDFEPQLTDANIKAIIQNIFAAGSEASATAMEWAMSEMIRKPQIMKRAQDEVRSLFDGQGYVDESRLHELKYLAAIIKEILRLHPSAPLLVPRESKARLFVNAWAIGRDPKYWIEAEKFNPSRFLDSRIDFQGDDFEYIPFGAGRRICPGIAFSQPVIQLALAQLLFHFDWKLPGDMKQEELDMTAKFGITMRRKNDLLLIPIPYSRSCLIMDNSTP